MAGTYVGDQCIVCLVNLHPHCVFQTITPGYGIGHFLFGPDSLSGVANFQISRSTPGAHFLKPTPWMHLWSLTVYSLVTALLMAEWPFSPPFFAGAILPTHSVKYTSLLTLVSTQIPTSTPWLLSSMGGKSRHAVRVQQWKPGSSLF